MDTDEEGKSKRRRKWQNHRLVPASIRGEGIGPIWKSGFIGVQAWFNGIVPV